MKYSLLSLSWLKTSWETPHVSWVDGWLENGFCRQCRLCCAPQLGDAPFPMRLLPHQVEGAHDSFYMLDSETACLDERGCKALGEKGCSLPREKRPLACGLFPLVLVSLRLYLYTFCPASFFIPLKEWHAIANNASSYLSSLSKSDRARISITLPDATLMDRYVFLQQSFEE